MGIPIESDPNVPVWKMYPNEMNSLYGLYAAKSELAIADELMSKRIKTDKYGKRDHRLAMKLLDKTILRIKRTMSPEKQEAVNNMLGRIRYRTWIDPTPVDPTGDACFVKASQLKWILIAAQDKCGACFGSDPSIFNKCKLGHALDVSLKIDRGDRCWGDIDFSDWAEEDS